MAINISEKQIWENIWNRSKMLFTKTERELIKKSRIGIIGVGGTGGISSETLVRTGVGNIVLADPDIFELSNLNRQHYCTISNIGKKKVLTAKKRLMDINPYASIKTYPEGFNKNNAEDILNNVDIIIDASDKKSAHYPLHRFAKEKRVPLISRSHRIPDMLFGAKANLWDYRKNGIKTREVLENSITVKYDLADIDEVLFKEKDNRVHREFNEIFNSIIGSNESFKLLFSEQKLFGNHFNDILTQDKIVQTTNWGPVVNMTGIFFATIAISLIIGANDIFWGPISFKSCSSLTFNVNQTEIM